jgi:hypothetical protein
VPLEDLKACQGGGLVWLESQLLDNQSVAPGHQDRRFGSQRIAGWAFLLDCALYLMGTSACLGSVRVLVSR